MCVSVRGQMQGGMAGEAGPSGLRLGWERWDRVRGRLAKSRIVQRYHPPFEARCLHTVPYPLNYHAHTDTHTHRHRHRHRHTHTHTHTQLHMRTGLWAPGTCGASPRRPGQQAAAVAVARPRQSAVASLLARGGLPRANRAVEVEMVSAGLRLCRAVWVVNLTSSCWCPFASTHFNAKAGRARVEKECSPV